MITRTQATKFPSSQGKPVIRDIDGWPVVVDIERVGPESDLGLTDLSHRPKAILHLAAQSALSELKPGQAKWDSKAIVGCIKSGSGFAFDLSSELPLTWPNANYTDVTEGYILYALWGAKALSVLQRLVAVDIEPHGVEQPVCVITSNDGVAVHVVNMKARQPGFLVACTRSQAQNFFDNCMRAGEQFNLQVKGLDSFSDWFSANVK